MEKILDNKKVFEKPVLEIMEFVNEDIIVTSSEGDLIDPWHGGDKE